MGAADYILIPAEASSKGLNSLIRTLELVQELQSIDAFEGAVLGVVPFRDRWTGRTQALQSKRSVEGMREIAGSIPILPSILESEQYKKAIDQGRALSEMGHPHLEHPFQRVVELLNLK